MVRGRQGRAVRLAAALVLAAGAADAHDFWIEPATYRPPVPSVLAVRLRVGDDFPNGEAYARNPAHVRRFVVAGPSGVRPVAGRAGSEPAGFTRIEEAGVHVLGYRSTRTILTLEAARFEAYLRTEGFEHVLRRRAERGETERPGREAFSRCAKAIVVAGGAVRTGWDRVLGFRLELVPGRNPGDLGPGDELEVRLLYEGEPLAGARVVARHAGPPALEVGAPTDARGRARLRLGRPGAWLVRAVHMVPAPAGVGAEWESLWASLTFVLPRGAPPALPATGGNSLRRPTESPSLPPSRHPPRDEEGP